METFKRSRGRPKSTVSSNATTNNLNGTNLNLTELNKENSIDTTDINTRRRSIEIDDTNIKKEKSEDEETCEDTPTECIKDVVAEIKEEKSVSTIIDNPKEKVPKGRKFKSIETVHTDNSSENDKEFDGMEHLLLVKEEPVDMDLYSGSSSEILGKGKRARIPNKRYSDIMLSPSQAKKASLSLETGNDTDTGVKEEFGSSPYTSSASRTSSPPLKKTKISTDLSHPKYLEPFKYGWRRELVWRGIYDESKSRVGDIYYFTPEGKKARSRREVSEHLKGSHLTIENFSFFKEAIGIDDPEKELIRDAKTKSETSIKSSSSGKSVKSKVQAQKTSKILVGEATSSKVTKQNVNNVGKSKFGSPKVRGALMKAKQRRKPKVSLTRLKGHGRIKAKMTLSEMSTNVPVKRRPRQVKNMTSTKIKKGPKKLEKTMEKMEVVESPPKAAPKRTRNSSFEGDDEQTEDIVVTDPDKPCQPCSIRCNGVQGTIPTLQCRICLCLYHHACVGYAPHLSLPYVCKNCHLEGQEQTSEPTDSTVLSALPPLTPINSLIPTNNQAITLPPPKLQKIPKPTESDPPTDLLKPNEEVEEEETLLVGSVTTWLPHNSKIVDDTNQTNEISNDFNGGGDGGGVGSSGGGTARPQFVEILAGRKFLVIPKQNFISVSPRLAAAAVTSADENLMDTDIKIEPDSPSKPENTQTAAAASAAIMDVVEDGAESTSGSGLFQDVKAENSSQKPTTSNAETTPTEPKNPAKKRTIKLSSITNGEEKDKEETRFMDNYLQNLSYGYNTLLYVFQYLKVQDLLRAGCVCTMWRDIAGHPMLWKTVRMKNSQVHSFEGLANSLQKHGTKHLDLRKMLLPTGGDEIWPEFSKAIEKVHTLRRIELCRCPASVVENLARSNPLLEVLNAVTIKCEKMNLEPLKSLKQIQELRLKSTGGLTLTSNIDSLSEMKCLRHLSLTSIRDLDAMNLNVIAELSNLESLDLGECTDFPDTFGGDILVKLTKLEKLRLEKGQGNCHTFEILEAVKQMQRLDQLELVNFDIKSGFDKALGACQNIKKLLIIPTYISQSATTNHMVLGGVLRLQKTLSHFVWGVTLELLRVTELFVDQCEEPKEKKEKKQAGNGDCIPVLKPVPLLLDKDNEIAPALEPPQVEILALPSLQKLLMQNLPTTRVKILKIPFHATWRQSITDSVN